MDRCGIENKKLTLNNRENREEYSVRSAMVIDDVTISTVPVVIGTGRRLFGGRPQTRTWTLASARSFPSGLVQAHYDRKR